MHYLWLVIFACLVISGCSQDVEGPEPQMSEEAEELATEPSFVCNEDPGTWVTVHGEDFSPLVIDTISREEDPDVELPIVTLTHRLTPTGDGIDDSTSITLESPVGGEEGAVRWIDDQTIEIYVTDELDLAEGVYDIRVENPNGTEVTKTETFGVLDRPRLDRAIPELTCVAQGSRDIVLEGDNLLILDGETPTIGLEDAEVEVIDTDHCRDLHTTFTGHQLCEEVTVRLEENSFDAGVYQVWAQNFDPAGCASDPAEDEVTITVNDPPQPEAISPTPICSEQLGYEAMQIDGVDFVVVRDDNGDEVYPTVTVGERSYDAIAADGCQEIETAPALGAERCTELTIAIEADDLADQVDNDTAYTDLDIVVTNPDPVGCHSTDEVLLTAVPPPMVAGVAPDPICSAQFENTLTISGHGFVSIGDSQPVVHIGEQSYPVEEMDECTEVPTPDTETTSCESLTITVPQGDLAAERTDVRVENPETAACESTEDSTVRVVPPPTVADIAPQPLCTEQQTRTLEVTGEDLLDIDGALPTVTIGDEIFETSEIDDCEELPLDEEEREVFRCTTLSIEVEPGMLDVAIHDVVVTNPETAACVSEGEVTVETVPAPEITSIQPRAICSSDDTTSFELEGNHLYEVDGMGPEIVLDGQNYETTATDCTEVHEDVRQCDRLSFEVDSDDISDDTHRLVAINPDPVGCESDPSDLIALIGPPQLVHIEPSAICEDEPIDADMTLFGQFVYDPDGEAPHLSMDGQSVSVDGLGDCTTTDLDDIDLDVCTELYAQVPTELRDQPFEITVSGADPFACGEDTIEIEQVERATVSAVTPQRVCFEGGTVDVVGENIHQDAQFFLDGTPAIDADVAADGTSATVTFEGPLEPPEMTFSAINPGDCGSSYETDLHIARAPIPLYVDPPATYDGISTQVTIYAAGISGGNIEGVELVHPDDGSTIALDPEIDEDRPYVVQAVIPEQILESGETSVDFGLRITDEFDCASDFEDLLTVTSELTIAVDEVSPPFGAQDDRTGVTITADDDPASGQVQFEATPRAYLNPADVDDDSTLAREVRSLQFVDETQLNGFVSSGLPLGTYDIIVVNPDGAVGLIEEGFTVTEERPPLVDSVSPGSWTNDQDALQVDIEGENFRDDPTVEVFCQAPGDDGDDFDEPNSIDIISADAESVVVEVDTNNLAHLDACFLRLTNTDGTFGDYSPVTVTNPAGNFVSFNPGADFDTARRGPTALSGVPSRQANFLYVLGGDDGSTDGEVYASGEFAPLNRFGEPQSWNYLPFELPSGRTLGNGVRVDDFLYIVGGFDAQQDSATGEIIRARVLDPDDAPEIVDIDLFYDEDAFADVDDSPEDEDGLEAGVYYYRVSALYSDTDPANPSGESLGSQIQPIKVPLDGATISIFWEEPETITHEIVGYRVYRSIDPDDPIGNEGALEILDADEFSFTDDGSEEPIAGTHPLRLGSLGTWHPVASLQHPRMVAGITSVRNPSNNNEHFVYTIGGEDADEEFRADYEFFRIEVDGPREQTVSDATIGQYDGEDMLFPSPRAELQAVTAHEGNSHSVSGVAPQIFTIAGQIAAGGGGPGGDAGNTTYVATVGDDGHLEAWTSTTELIGAARYGHAAAAINNNLVAIGGTNGDPSPHAYHSEILCGGDCPPASAGSWESLSDVSVRDRVWMGHVTFRGFYFLAGGLTTGNVPSNTVDFSVAGGTP